MDVKSYHALLPVYLQDILRAAVKSGGEDERRFMDVVYMSGLERSIEWVKNACPQAFKSGDDEGIGGIGG